jgi:hypothetical protein
MVCFLAIIKTLPKLQITTKYHWFLAFSKVAINRHAIQTGKKPGIVLILETMKDRKFWIRLNTTVEYFGLPIDTWNIGNAEY